MNSKIIEALRLLSLMLLGVVISELYMKGFMILTVVLAISTFLVTITYAMKEVYQKP